MAGEPPGPAPAGRQRQGRDRPDWNEMLLDPTTAAKRDELARVIGGWIAGCAADGFDAVEIDNLDSFTRTHGRIGEDDAVAQVRLYADAAHANGLAIAQKNSAEIIGSARRWARTSRSPRNATAGTECDAYTGAYGDHVLVIEYRRRDFAAGCAAYPGLSIILRDLDLVPGCRRPRAASPRPRAVRVDQDVGPLVRARARRRRAGSRAARARAPQCVGRGRRLVSAPYAM